MVHLMQGDCSEKLRELRDETIDLTITSPPYDKMRKYKGNDIEWGEQTWKKVAKQLYRITKRGGVVVWVVGDQTIKGNETGTSFYQALWFKHIGFNLHDTMIYSKGGQGACGSNLCYLQDFEYMFIFGKGRPKSIHLIEDRVNKVKPRTAVESQGHRHQTGEKKGTRKIERKRLGRRTNIWQYHESGTRVPHPAVFPMPLATSHLLSWSNPQDIVLDPFMGSGTVGVACLLHNRSFVGIEASKKFYDMAKKRIDKVADGNGDPYQA